MAHRGTSPTSSGFGDGRSGRRNDSLAGNGNVRGQRPGFDLGFLKGPVPAQMSAQGKQALLCPTSWWSKPAAHHRAPSPTLRPPTSLSVVANSPGDGGGEQSSGLDSQMPGFRDCPAQFLQARGIGDLHHRVLPPPSFSSTPQPHLSAALGWWEVLGSPTQGIPSLPFPVLLTPSSVSLTTFLSLRPHWPLVQPVRQAPSSSIPLQGSLSPRPWGSADDEEARVMGNCP